MEKKIVVGNMKMNLEAMEIEDYLMEINIMDYNKQVVFCPSSLYLPYFIGRNYEVGSQNIAPYEEGAYTGEISAAQLVSMGIGCTLIGHSERREHFKETDEVVRKKTEIALKSNLKVILCIGETEDERDDDKTYKVLQRQITTALKGIAEEYHNKLIIAYEPIWAIGTGRTPTNIEIEDAISFIKTIVEELWFKDMKVIYGGSVSDENIIILEQIENIGGYLVGGASIDPVRFKKIIEVVVNQ